MTLNLQRVGKTFWEPVTRKADLGIEVQLVHPAGERCNVRETVENFTVMHTTGLHRVRMHFCRCSQGVLLDRYTQLIRARLWPATVAEPETASTFEALDDFNRLSLLGRLTSYDYYKAMVASTDAFGLLKIPVRAIQVALPRKS